jgi:ABC-type uncharacterized transport system permease subunit
MDIVRRGGVRVFLVRGNERMPVPLSVWTFVLMAGVCGGLTISRVLLAVHQALSDRSITGVAVALMALAAGPFSTTVPSVSSGPEPCATDEAVA